MKFEEAINLMEEGHSVIMEGWNFPKGSYLSLLPMPLLPEVKDFYIKVPEKKGFQPFTMSYSAYCANWIILDENK